MIVLKGGRVVVKFGCGGVWLRGRVGGRWFRGVRVRR